LLTLSLLPFSTFHLDSAIHWWAAILLKGYA